MIGELPLSELPALISYAEECEAVEATRSLYIAHYLIARLNNTDPIGYDAYIKDILNKKTASPARDPKAIETDFDAIEARYRKKKEG